MVKTVMNLTSNNCSGCKFFGTVGSLTGCTKILNRPERTFFINRDISFEEWLYINYHETPESLYHVAMVTGTQADYDKALYWYRQLYFKQLTVERQSNQLTINQFLENGGN